MTKFVTASKLDRTVELFAPGAAVDDGFTTKPGPPVSLGTRRASVRAEYRPERLEALGLTGKSVITVWLRSDSLTRALTEENTLAFEGRAHELVGRPVELGRREGIELVAVAVD